MTSEAAAENWLFHTSAHTAVNQHFGHIIHCTTKLSANYL